MLAILECFDLDGGYTDVRFMTIRGRASFGVCYVAQLKIKAKIFSEPCHSFLFRLLFKKIFNVLFFILERDRETESE